MPDIFIPAPTRVDAPPPGITPDQAGFASWNMPPSAAGATTAITNGVVNAVKLPWPYASKGVTAIGMMNSVAGATLSGSQVGIVNMSGVVLATASADAAFLGTNYQQVAISVAASAMPAFGDVYVCFLAVGTTGPTMLRGSNGTSSQVSLGQTGPNLLFCILGNLTGRSSIPAGPITLSSNAVSGNTIFAALK